MQQPVTRSIGGTVLAASAIALAAGVILHPAPVGTLAAYAESPGGWQLAAWLMALAGMLWLAGTVVLARQFNGTRSEAWATLGYAGALFGAVALFAAGAIESFGLEGLATGTIAEHTAEAYTALIYTNLGLAMMGITAYYAAVALFGLAMVREDAWPAWLGWSGIAIGGAVVALHVITQASGAALNETLAVALYVIGMVWVAVAGWTLREMGRPAPAAPSMPERTTMAGMG